mmetsp:Transcript_5059/g.13032  ORF Transcript_5059/g.13032 Transcript_5059/m.13032 type:complete len:267 (-) Transcript_5059:189-989(-)
MRVRTATCTCAITVGLAAIRLHGATAARSAGLTEELTRRLAHELGEGGVSRSGGCIATTAAGTRGLCGRSGGLRSGELARCGDMPVHGRACLPPGERVERVVLVAALRALRRLARNDLRRLPLDAAVPLVDVGDASRCRRWERGTLDRAALLCGAVVDLSEQRVEALHFRSVPLLQRRVSPVEQLLPAHSRRADDLLLVELLLEHLRHLLLRVDVLLRLLEAGHLGVHVRLRLARQHRLLQQLAVLAQLVVSEVGVGDERHGERPA